jgi:hypothetical protein
MADAYVSIYSQPDPGKGIEDFDLASPNDRGFAFDYDHSGNLDHMVFFRPGSGMISIIKRSGDTFSTVFHSDVGLPFFDLSSPADLGLAFDFDHSGKNDYLVFYRPGSRMITVLKNQAPNFTAVFASTSGIGGYDLASPSDLVIAYDYNHRGNLDYLTLYRPGNGIIWILENHNGNFNHVLNSDSGIGGYDLQSPLDRVYALDLDSSGRKDYLALYRAGAGIYFILRNNGGNSFTQVYAQPGAGIGGYDLLSPLDTSLAYDYEATGKLDHIVLYRPGNGMIWIIKKISSGPKDDFAAVLSEGDPGVGIGDYDLRSPTDLVFAFDADSKGILQDLVLYRPGTGKISVLTKK